MGKSIVKQTSAAFDNFKADNPLMVRKKLQMKDVYFRRNLPEQEIFRCEVAFDTELYVLLMIAVAVMLFIFCKLVSSLSAAKMTRRRGRKARV